MILVHVIDLEQEPIISVLNGGQIQQLIFVLLNDFCDGGGVQYKKPDLSDLTLTVRSFVCREGVHV